jgi:hypothetical protein
MIALTVIPLSGLYFITVIFKFNFRIHYIVEVDTGDMFYSSYFDNSKVIMFDN